MKKLILGITFLMIAGCSKKPIVKTEPTPEPQTAPQQEEVELLLKGKDFTAVGELEPVYFDLDKSEIRNDMIAVAQKNADFLKSHPKIEVRIDGHCDERGTTEYNLALGQRRAATMRAYYKSLGIPSNRMGTQSWGEEKPVCFEAAEDCHSKNRRAETLARVVKQEVKEIKEETKK